MSKFYCVRWKSASKGTMVFAPKDTELGHRLIPKLEGKDSLPFEFILNKFPEDIPFDYHSGVEIVWEDYLASNKFNLISKRLKIIIDSHLTSNEGIDWISCKVNAGREQQTYYVLSFNQKLDVLDMGRITETGQKRTIGVFMCTDEALIILKLIDIMRLKSA